jgi:hypothetical protein
MFGHKPFHQINTKEISFFLKDSNKLVYQNCYMFFPINKINFLIQNQNFHSNLDELLHLSLYKGRYLL